MESRLRLQAKLEELLGSKNVYFQPPQNIRMQYPAIVYSLSNIRNTFADDAVYSQSYFYQLTVIDYDPDSEIVKKVSKLPTISFDRFYTSDNLNHTVFTIYH